MDQLVAQKVHAMIQDAHLGPHVELRGALFVQRLEHYLRIIRQAHLSRLRADREHEAVLDVQV